jgi:hypothetical protein
MSRPNALSGRMANCDAQHETKIVTVAVNPSRAMTIVQGTMGGEHRMTSADGGLMPDHPTAAA